MMSLRRNLGKLVVLGGEVFRKSNDTSRRTILTSIKDIYASSTIFSSFNSLHFSGYTESRHYHADAETKGGCDHTFERKIRKGDTICLNDLLFTNNRDYLIKNNNQHVKAEHLEGKVIGIYFVPLSDIDSRHSAWYTALLKDVYDDLHAANNFEAILVACDIIDSKFRKETPVHRSLLSDSQKVFEGLFSNMPWTAIPFSDVTSRKHMQKSFGVIESYVFRPIMYIVDQTGLVLQYDSWDIFEYYGALGHPFSDKRLKFLRTEDYLVTQQPSLIKLLGSPQRDYVISNNGDKVPIHTFEHKVVGLYFYHPDIDPSGWQTEELLKLAYEEFANIKKVFEVVLVYRYEPSQRHHWSGEKLFWKSEESFWEKFKTMPWLALPFKDMSYKKLMRVFKFRPDDDDDAFVPSLVIVGPHADYIEPFGCSTLFKYGNGGYPFTHKKAAELENEKIKELKLEMLWDPNTIFRKNDGSQVSLPQLSGKRVMLVLESFNKSISVDDGSLTVKSITEFLTMLKERYLQNKGTDDEFEVIRILVNNTESSISKQLVGDMPWLVSPGSKLMHELDASYFWYGRPTCDLLELDIPIFAFGADGKLVRKTMYPTFETSEFPFYAGSLEEETLSQFTTYWGFNVYYGSKGPIYT